jgi:RNA polymerase sigma-54 factor
MLQQRLQQKLLQKLSPQQIQLMKLLQVPALLLEQRIKQEIEENPALEEGLDDMGELEVQHDDYDDGIDDSQGDGDVEVTEHNPDDEFDISDYIDDDETPAYKLSVNNNSTDDEQRDIPYASGTSFQEFLQSQLGLRRLTEREVNIAMHIIGNIDDSGYLQRDIHSLIDDLAFNQNIQSNFKELLGLIRVIQEFDPPGVGARDLQECLLIQIRRKSPKTLTIKNATLLLEKSFTDFTRKHYDKIRRKHGFTELMLKEAIDEVLKLNPKPGSSFQDSDRTAQYIVPDFIVTNYDGQLELTLTSRNAPDLRINRTYAEMLETMAESKGRSNPRQKEAIVFVKQKLDSAKWFIDAIRQRQNTLMVLWRQF